MLRRKKPLCLKNFELHRRHYLSSPSGARPGELKARNVETVRCDADPHRDRDGLLESSLYETILIYCAQCADIADSRNQITYYLPFIRELNIGLL